MENAAHSYTEAASVGPTKEQINLYRNTTELADALQTFIQLHDREAEGDESITTKEWNEAIKAGKAALRTQ